MFSKKLLAPLPYTRDQWEEALSTVRKTKTGKESKAKSNCSEVVSQLIKGSTTGIFTMANPSPHVNRSALTLDPSFITREPDYSSLPIPPVSSSTTTELSYVTLGNSYLSYSTTSPDSINNQIIPITDSYAYKNSSGNLVTAHEFKGDVEKNLTQHIEFDVADIKERLQKLARAETSEFILVALTLTPIEIIDPTEKNKEKAEMDAVKRLNAHINGGHVILVQYVTANFQSNYGIPRLIVIDPARDVGTNIEKMFSFVNIDQPEQPKNDLFDRNIGCMLINTEARIKINTRSLPAIKKEDSLHVYSNEKDRKSISSNESNITETLPGSQKRKLPAFLKSNPSIIIPSQFSAQFSQLPNFPKKNTVEIPLSKKIKLKDPKLQNPEKKSIQNKLSFIQDIKLTSKEKTAIAPEKVLFDMLNDSDFSQRYSESYKLLIKQPDYPTAGKIMKISPRFKSNTRVLYEKLGKRDFREVLNDENYTLSEMSLVDLMTYNAKSTRFFLAVLMASAFYNKNKSQIAPYLSKYSPQAKAVPKNVLTKNAFYNALIKDQKPNPAELPLNIDTDSASPALFSSASENFGKIFFSDPFKGQYNNHRASLGHGRKILTYSRAYKENIALLYHVLRCPNDIKIALETNILTVEDFKCLIGKPIPACRCVIACLLASNTLQQNVLLLEKMSSLVKHREKPKKPLNSLNSNPPEVITTPVIAQKRPLDSHLPGVMTPPIMGQLNDMIVRLQKDSQEINRYLQHDLLKFTVELKRLKLETPYQLLYHLQPILQEYLNCIHFNKYQKIHIAFSQLQALYGLLEKIKKTHISNPIIKEGYKNIMSLVIYLSASQPIVQKFITPSWTPKLFPYPAAASTSSSSSASNVSHSSSRTLSS